MDAYPCQYASVHIKNSSHFNNEAIMWFCGLQHPEQTKKTAAPNYLFLYIDTKYASYSEYLQRETSGRHSSVQVQSFNFIGIIHHALRALRYLRRSNQ